MKRKFESSATIFTKFRPISQRQVQKFLIHKSGELAAIRNSKRLKFSKNVSLSIANLTTSYTEKLLNVACTIARERHNKEGRMLLDGTEISIIDIEKASAYVLTPYLSDRLVSRRKVINSFLYATIEDINEVDDGIKVKDVNEYLLVENNGTDIL